jgi:hypothetical protein
MCGPRGLQGEPDHLFHNNGGWGKSRVSCPSFGRRLAKIPPRDGNGRIVASAISSKKSKK